MAKRFANLSATYHSPGETSSHFCKHRFCVHSVSNIYFIHYFLLDLFSIAQIWVSVVEHVQIFDVHIIRTANNVKRIRSHGKYLRRFWKKTRPSVHLRFQNDECFRATFCSYVAENFTYSELLHQQRWKFHSETSYIFFYKLFQWLQQTYLLLCIIRRCIPMRFINNKTYFVFAFYQKSDLQLQFFFHMKSISQNENCIW